VRWSQAWVRVLRITEVNVTLFLGCLSPGEMVLSTQVGWYAAAFSVAIVFASVLLSLNRDSFVWSLICVMLLVLHPAWTMGVDSAGLEGVVASSTRVWSRTASSRARTQ
jgi:hypothetical protein